MAYYTSQFGTQQSTLGKFLLGSPGGTQAGETAICICVCSVAGQGNMTFAGSTRAQSVATISIPITVAYTGILGTPWSQLGKFMLGSPAPIQFVFEAVSVCSISTLTANGGLLTLGEAIVNAKAIVDASGQVIEPIPADWMQAAERGTLYPFSW